MEKRNNKRKGLWTVIVVFALALGIGAMQGSTFAAIQGRVAQPANIGTLPPPMSSHLPPSTVGDANSDGVVDTIDFAILKGTFGRACGNLGFDARADFNSNCVVNAVDFNILKRNFGLLVGGPLDPPPPDTSGGAHLFISPGQGGSPTCSAPIYNGSIEAGCRFVLDLSVDAGSHDLAAAQSYLTFDPQLIKNARVSSLGTSCVLTGTLTPDLTTFDTVLQNEVCIGPSSCTFRNVLSTLPGSIGYAAGVLSNCETGCSGVFRIAQIGLCAITPGHVILHWQFWPTDGLRNRHSDIATVVDANGDVTLVQDSASFHDYIFDITPPAATGSIAGIVYRHDPSQPPDTVLGGAPVQACATTFNFCGYSTSLADGTYTVSNLPDGNYRVTAYPPSGPAGADLTQGLINNLINISGGGAVIGQTVVLNTVLLPPAGTTISPSQPGGNGVPRVNWTQILTLHTTGCVGTATYELHLDNGVVLTGNMVGDGSGNYSANIGQLNPNHGFGYVVMTIMCSGGGSTAVTFNIYIDPSGNVKTVEGVPIQGATVTLYRSVSLSGPFTQVANGDSVMSEENRVNPDTTDVDGHFGWDVIAGYYKVRAEKAGCVSPSDPNQTYVESGALTIPHPSLTWTCV